LRRRPVYVGKELFTWAVEIASLRDRAAL